MSTKGPDAKKSLACPKCGNALRILAEQIGSQIKCPKCNATFVVANNTPRGAADSSSAGDNSDDGNDDAYEPEIPLTPSRIVDESPKTPLAPVSLAERDDDWDMENYPQGVLPSQPRVNTDDQYLELAKVKGILRNERAIKPPRNPFSSGVYDFPWQGPNIARLAGMACGLVVAGEVLLVTASTMTAQKSMGWLAMPLLSVATAIVAFLVMSYCAPCFLAAIQDTADGHREVQESTLPPFDQWFFSAVSLVTVLVVSGAAGYPLSLVEEIGLAAIPAVMLLVFPVLLLSAMEGGSFLMPFSPPVLASLFRKFGAWLAFYFVSTLLWGAWLAGTVLALPYAPGIVVLISALVLAWLLLVYARLLGRMAWVIAGKPVIMEDIGFAKPPRSAEPTQ